MKKVSPNYSEVSSRILIDIKSKLKLAFEFIQTDSFIHSFVFTFMNELLQNI